MKKFLIVVLSIGLIFVSADAQNKKKKSTKKKSTPPCAASIDDCSLDGCSPDNHHDPLLNQFKNIPNNSKAPTDRSLAWMKALDDPSNNYKPGGARHELKDLGEGNMIRLVGYLLVVKPELGGESCNCYLKTPEETDNHLVLVTGTTINKYKLPPNARTNDFKRVFGQREPESVTVEFTPRVREEHPNFTLDFLEPLVRKTPQGALWVRVTGQQLFDSEHWKHNKLKRVNNWELHPVMKLEYCPKNKQCTSTSDDNWIDIDGQ
jgi:hypothetical protein